MYCLCVIFVVNVGLDLEDSLAEVVTLEHANETLGRIIDTLSDVQLRLDAAVLDPGLQALLVLLEVRRAEVGGSNEETLKLELLEQDLVVVLESRALFGGLVVVGDETADGDTSVGVHAVERSLEVLGTDVLEVDVDTVGRQTLEGIGGGLLLVVEAGVETELLGDEVELLVGADGADDAEAFALGDLADDLADGTGGGAEEEGLALLGLANLVESRPASETRHTEGTEEVSEVEVMRVLDLPDHPRLGVCDNGVLSDGNETNHKVTLLVLLRLIGLDDLTDTCVHDNVAGVEGGGVGLGVGIAHLAAEVRVERGILDLEDEAAGRESGVFDVERTVLDDEVLAGDGEAGGELLVDERLVLDHDCGFCVGLWWRCVGRLSL